MHTSSKSEATWPPGIFSKTQSYIPQGKNILHSIFEKHFTDFCDVYEEQYADKYGKFHLDGMHTDQAVSWMLVNIFLPVVITLTV